MFWSIAPAPAHVTVWQGGGRQPPLIRDNLATQALSPWQIMQAPSIFGKIRSSNLLIITLPDDFFSTITYFSLQCTVLWSGILASLSSVLSSLCDREQRSPCPAHNHDNYAPAVGGMHDLFNSGIYVTSLHTVTLVTGKLRDKRKFKWVVGHFIVMCSLWWSGHGNIDSIVAHFHPRKSFSMVYGV